MRNREINKQIQRIRFLIDKTDEVCSGNIELYAEWAKYITMLSAGLIENSLKLLYIEFANNKAPKPIARYISSNISSIRNPKTEKFLLIAEAFNPTWKKELELYLNDEGRYEAIDSIMNQRHLIAHGKSILSNITMSKIKEYLEKSIEVLEFIEQQCNI